MTDLEFARLKSLSEELVDAFKSSTHTEFFAEQTSVYYKDDNYLAIMDDMERVFKRNQDVADKEVLAKLNRGKKLIDHRTFYKIVKPNRADKDISPNVRKKINDYIYLIRVESSNSDVSPTIELHGAYLINDAFSQSKSKPTNFKVIDFYTSKSNDDIQWAGVLDGYDIERSNFGKLKLSALTAFNVKNSKVNSVIIGKSGSGKTTVLRRLATECIGKTKFHILWIYDVGTFKFSALKRQEKYLIIIDDWSKAEKTPEAKQSFLNNVHVLGNVRLIVGDYILREEIENMLYGDSVFELSPENNKDIIKSIINNVDVWKKREDDILELDDKLFNAPLFIVLFVIAKKFSNDTALDFEDFEAEFKKIVKNDLKEVYSKYPIIALLLYYTACLTKRRIQFTWEAFLMLAKSYDETFVLKQSFMDFSLNNSVVQVMRQYISLRQFTFPGHNDGCVIEFNHDLLLNALTNPLQSEWNMDDEAELTLFDHLLKIEAYDIAYYMELEIGGSKVYEKYRETYEELIETMSNAEPMLWLLCSSDSIVGLYKNFRRYSEQELENSLYSIFMYLSVPGTTKRQYLFLKSFVSWLAKSGCQSRTINDLYELIDDEKKLSDYLWNKFGYFRRRHKLLIDSHL